MRMCIERVLFIWKFDSHICYVLWGGGGGGGGVNVTIYIICNGYSHFLRRIYEFNFTFSK